MVNPALSAYQRAFPPRELFRGVSRAAFFWSALAAVLYAALLVLFGLLISLLVTRGQIVLKSSDHDSVIALAGGLFDSELQAAKTQNGGLIVLGDTGLFPAIWNSRDTLVGPLMAKVYRRTPSLQSSPRALVALLLASAVCGLVRALALARAGNLSERAGHEVASSLRRAIHRQALRLGPGDLRDNSGKHPLTLFLQDADTVRVAVSTSVARLSRFPFKLCLLAGLAVVVHWRMTMLAVLPLVGTWWLVHKLRQSAERTRQLAYGKANSELNQLAESFETTRLVRGFSMENWEHDQFNKRLERYQQNMQAAGREQRWIRWTIRLLIAGGLTLVAFLAGSKVLQTPDDLPFAKAALLLVTVAAMYRPLELLRQLETLQREASLAADRIFRYTDQLPEVSQAVGAKFLNPMSRSLRFEHVTWELSRQRRILDRMDLQIQAGETVAVVSLDPIECRALANLLPRFSDPAHGRILIDGEDIAMATLESLRAEVLYVTGSDPCFTGTIFENITCGNPEYTLADVTAAAKMSHAHNFIQRLPQGYESYLGSHGETLDAGQTFRLSLARAVLRNPALLIIEEPTEPLDDDTKDLLDDAYNRILKDRTVLLLPSRMSTVRRADRIIFLHKGRVEAIGKQADMVKKVPLYRHWEYVNFNEFRHEVEPAVSAEA